MAEPDENGEAPNLDAELAAAADAALEAESGGEDLPLAAGEDNAAAEGGEAAPAPDAAAAEPAKEEKKNSAEEAAKASEEPPAEDLESEAQTMTEEDLEAMEAARQMEEMAETKQLRRRFRNAGGGIGSLFRAMASSDKATRRMGYLFFMSITWLLFVGFIGYSFFRYRSMMRERSMMKEERFEEFLKEQKEEAFFKYAVLELGKFMIELNPVPGERPKPGVMNLAEVEVVVQCDRKEACDDLYANYTKVRDRLTTVLTPMDRDWIQSEAGKQKLKEKIKTTLNTTVRVGSIERVFFRRLIIN